MGACLLSPQHEHPSLMSVSSPAQKHVKIYNKRIIYKTSASNSANEATYTYFLHATYNLNKIKDSKSSITSTICPGLSSGNFLGGSGAPSVSPKAPRASSDMNA